MTSLLHSERWASLALYLTGMSVVLAALIVIGRMG